MVRVDRDSEADKPGTVGQPVVQLYRVPKGMALLSLSRSVGRDVIGWRAGCECGWRGIRFYSRRERPNPADDPQTDVDGRDTGGGYYADWSGHLDRALQLNDVLVHLDVAECDARRAGFPWSLIGRAARVTASRVQRRCGGAGSVGPLRPAAAARRDVRPVRQLHRCER